MSCISHWFMCLFSAFVCTDHNRVQNARPGSWLDDGGTKHTDRTSACHLPTDARLISPAWTRVLLLSLHTILIRPACSRMLCRLQGHLQGWQVIYQCQRALKDYADSTAVVDHVMEMHIDFSFYYTTTVVQNIAWTWPLKKMAIYHKVVFGAGILWAQRLSEILAPWSLSEILCFLCV